MSSSISKTFVLSNNVTINSLAQAVENFLHYEKGLETQSGQTQQGYVVQGRQGSDGWKTISGTSMAITVQFVQVGENVNVSIGDSKWSDKVGAGAIGLFVFWPLAVTAGYGAYKQKKLPEEIFSVIEKTIFSGNQQVVINNAGSNVDPSSKVCPQCKAINPISSKFCSKCGALISGECPSCGAPINPNDKFCSKCGKALK